MKDRVRTGEFKTHWYHLGVYLLPIIVPFFGLLTHASGDKKPPENEKCESAMSASGTQNLRSTVGAIDVRHVISDDDEALWKEAMTENKNVDAGVFEVFDPSGTKVLKSSYVFTHIDEMTASKWIQGYHQMLRRITNLKVPLNDYRLRFTLTHPYSDGDYNSPSKYLTMSDVNAAMHIRDNLDRNRKLKDMDFEIVAITRAPDSSTETTGLEDSRWHTTMRQIGTDRGRYRSSALVFPHK
jgi:hypothetical protein